MKKSQTYIAIPPGTTIKEQLVDRGMKQKEFAARMGMSEKHISKLINGDVQLTIEMARKLEMVLGVPTQFWCNLETIYREDLAKVREEAMMDADIEIAKNMPYDDMVQKGWIIDVDDNTERVIHLRKYFEIAELRYLQKTLLPRIACRKLSEKEESDCALIAWAQKAKLEARKVETERVDIEKLKTNIPKIQEWMHEEPEKCYSKLSELLAGCGIAIIFLSQIDNSFFHGATFLDDNKIVMGLYECRGDRREFWFNLFHEIAHVIYGHIEKHDGISKEDEKHAEEYARSMSIN